MAIFNLHESVKEKEEGANSHPSSLGLENQ